MFRLLDQFLFVPLSVLVFLFGLGWLAAHPPALTLTILGLITVFIILWIREKLNPSLKKTPPPNLKVKRKTEYTEADFWKWFNGQNKK